MLKIQLLCKRFAKSVFGENIKPKLQTISFGLRYFPILGFADIQGWLTPREAAALFDLACSLPSVSPRVVEIGSWQGKSTVAIAKGLRRHSDARMYCIDPFNADGEETSRKDYEAIRATLSRPLKSQFLENIENNGLKETIEVWQGYSTEFSRNFPIEIDLLFIDGNHAYDAVLADVREWSKYLKPGGVIALHDVDRSGGEEGPWRVVQELLLTGSDYCDHQFVDSLFYARKTTSDLPSRAATRSPR